jgi:hypothetical protein
VLLARTCAAWLEGASPEHRALVEHALRSAVKRGEADALRLLGYGKEAAVSVDEVQFDPARVAIGGRVSLSFLLRSRSPRPQDLLVDLAVHFVKAGRPRRGQGVQAQARLAPGPGRPGAANPDLLAVHNTRKPNPGPTRSTSWSTERRCAPAPSR